MLAHFVFLLHCLPFLSSPQPWMLRLHCPRWGKGSSQPSPPHRPRLLSSMTAPAAVREICPFPSLDQSTVRGLPQVEELLCLHPLSLLLQLQPPLQPWHQLVPQLLHRALPSDLCCRKPRKLSSPNFAGPLTSYKAQPHWKRASSSAASSTAVPTRCAASRSSPSSCHRLAETLEHCFCLPLSWSNDSGSVSLLLRDDFKIGQSIMKIGI